MRNVFEIHLDNLEVEWAEQPALYRKYARKLTKARQQLRELEAKLEVIDAELDLAIRTNPAKYLGNKVKLSEKVIANAVILQKRHQKSQDEVNQAKHRVDICQGWINTLENRKKALENEVTLFGLNYFSLPKISGKAKDRWEKEERKRVFTFSESKND